MEAPPILSEPPVIGPEPGAQPPPPIRPPVAAWRRWVMLVLLLGYVLGIGLMSGMQDHKDGPILPASTRLLVLVCAQEIGVFALLFGLVWFIGRPTPQGLYLRGWDGVRTLVWSVLWSLGIRLLAIPAVGAYGVVLYLIRQMRDGGGAMAMDDLRPKFENLLPTEAFSDPLYVILASTVLSFGLGGFREELWRAGVLSSFQSLLPARWRNGWGAAAGIVLAALVFGSAHITQGGVGVVATTAIGLGLGAIMVWRKSYWEAALAHGFFDASTMVLLWAIQHYQPELLRQLAPH